jgi:hypothetical protein
MAFLGAYPLSLLGNGPGTQRHIEFILGAALLAGAGAMAFRDLWGRKCNCCGATVRVVYSSTELPGGLTGFRQLEAGGSQAA